MKFDLTGLEIRGEWDEKNRLLLLENVGGTLSFSGRIMGRKLNARAGIETALNDLVYLRFDKVDGIPSFLVPWVLKLLFRFNKKVANHHQAMIVHKDAILIDPNLLFAEAFNGRVLIQPKDGTGQGAERLVPKLRDRILNWVKEHGSELAGDIIEMVLIVPDLTLLLIKLMKDERVPVELKLKISLAVAYVISPIDLIPEALGSILGFVDDTLVMVVLITELVEEIPNEIIYDNWNGRSDILELIFKGKNILVKILPVNVTKKIQSLFSISKNEAAVSIEENNAS